jgi:hypothetical protein
MSVLALNALPLLVIEWIFYLLFPARPEYLTSYDLLNWNCTIINYQYHVPELFGRGSEAPPKIAHAKSPTCLYFLILQPWTEAAEAMYIIRLAFTRNAARTKLWADSVSHISIRMPKPRWTTLHKFRMFPSHQVPPVPATSP